MAQSACHLVLGERTACDLKQLLENQLLEYQVGELPAECLAHFGSSEAGL